MNALAAAALTAALAVPGARVDLVALQPSVPTGCTVSAAEAPRPLSASGRVALRLTGMTRGGAACAGWAWAKVRVLGPALVAGRDLAEGAPLEGAVTPGEREILAGRVLVAALQPGATASRALSAGTVLEPQHVRCGPRPGEPIAVLVRVGALSVEQPGRAIACARGRVCAILPSGQRVEGSLDQGRLVLESP